MFQKYNWDFPVTKTMFTTILSHSTNMYHALISVSTRVEVPSTFTRGRSIAVRLTESVGGNQLLFCRREKLQGVEMKSISHREQIVIVQVPSLRQGVLNVNSSLNNEPAGHNSCKSQMTANINTRFKVNQLIIRIQGLSQVNKLCKWTN